VTPVLGSRDLFPDLDVPHYLNAASVSPLSKPVTEAMMASLMHQARGGVSAVEHFSASVEGVRSAFGTLVGAASADVAVLANTSAGVTAVASCLDWRPGDRVLLFSGDFPTNITPWQQAAKRYELELVWMDGDRFRTDIGGILDDIEREISRGLRLIAVSAVSFVTGRRRPVEHLARRCRAADTELFVDAIQALGVSPLRMDCGIDYMAAGGHKWLGGPFGTGVMAVAPRRWSQLGGTVASWLSHPEPLGFLFGDRGLLAHDKPLVWRVEPLLAWAQPGCPRLSGYSMRLESRRLVSTSTVSIRFSPTACAPVAGRCCGRRTVVSARVRWLWTPKTNMLAISLWVSLSAAYVQPLQMVTSGSHRIGTPIWAIFRPHSRHLTRSLPLIDRSALAASEHASDAVRRVERASDGCPLGPIPVH
jgi:hypothetical protein